MQLGYKDGYSSDSIIKLDCGVMQLEESSNICVGSLMILGGPYCFIIVSTTLSS